MSFERDSPPFSVPHGPDLSTARALLFVALLACAGVEAAGQTSPTGAGRAQREDAAPPPMRYLPEETRAKLAAARDMKARTRLSLELADARLVSAAAYTNADRFDAATLELGVYAAIVKDSIDFVKKTGKSSGKTRDLFKRIELTLRSHVPRLETLRRSLPSQYAVHVQTTLDFVRAERSRALDSFFDDTVVPERAAPSAPPPEGERATGANPSAPVRERKPDQR